MLPTRSYALGCQRVHEQLLKKYGDEIVQKAREKAEAGAWSTVLETNLFYAGYGRVRLERRQTIKLGFKRWLRNVLYRPSSEAKDLN